jgi:hypothetical protein
LTVTAFEENVIAVEPDVVPSVTVFGSVVRPVDDAMTVPFRYGRAM